MMMAMVFAGCADEIVNTTHNHFPQAPAFDPYREYDVIVVGTGITGFASFFALKELGPSIVGRELDILFIERAAITGGLSNTAGGIFNNANMLFAGHPTRAPAAQAANTGTRVLFETWHYNEMRGNADSLHQNHTATTVRRVGGVPVYPFMDKLWTAASNALPSRDLIESLGVQIAPGSGRAVMERMTAAARARYGQDSILLNATAVGLFTAPLLGPYGNSVVGVQIRLNDRVYDVRARYVIMATGNAGNNLALLAEWEDDSENQPAVYLSEFMMRAQALNLDGLGIEIMRDDANAAVFMGGFGAVSNAAFGRAWFNDNRFHAAFAINSNSTDAFNAPALLPMVPNSIVVTGEGRRFRAENDINSGRGAARMMTLNRPPYWIYTDTLPQVMDGANPAVIAGRTTQEWLAFAAERAAAESWNPISSEIVSSTSIAGLAALMFPGNTAVQDAFIAEVVAYNTAVAAATWVDPITVQASAAYWPPIGRGKLEDNALLITGSTFYAIRIYPSGWDTFGGVITNSVGAVYNRAGVIIPGLFAVGGASNRDLFDQHYLGGTSVTIYPGIGHAAALEVMRQLAP